MFSALVCGCLSVPASEILRNAGDGVVETEQTTGTKLTANRQKDAWFRALSNQDNLVDNSNKALMEFGYRMKTNGEFRGARKDGRKSFSITQAKKVAPIQLSKQRARNVTKTVLKTFIQMKQLSKTRKNLDKRPRTETLYRLKSSNSLKQLSRNQVPKSKHGHLNIRVFKRSILQMHDPGPKQKAPHGAEQDAPEDTRLPKWTLPFLLMGVGFLFLTLMVLIKRCTERLSHTVESIQTGTLVKNIKLKTKLSKNKITQELFQEGTPKLETDIQDQLNKMLYSSQLTLVKNDTNDINKFYYDNFVRY